MGRAHIEFLCGRIPLGVTGLHLTFDTENDYLPDSSFAQATRSSGSIDRWIDNVVPLCIGLVSRANTVVVRSVTHAYVSTILFRISVADSARLATVDCYARRPSLSSHRLTLPPISTDCSLLELRLNGIAPVWTVDTVYMTLTHLSLRNIFAPVDMVVLRALITSSPALINLELVLVNIVWDLSSDCPSISAPAVTHLTFGLLFHLPAKLVLPALQSLSIESSLAGWTETLDACSSYLETIDAFALECRTLDLTALTMMGRLRRAKYIDLSDCSPGFVDFVGENLARSQPKSSVTEWVVPFGTPLAVIRRFLRFSESPEVVVYERSKEQHEMEYRLTPASESF
ncbi:hypothetical protein R3P38DRAFT_3226879 [Favolaschia claudopus]|uniref:Uncharacterized protein n=1 Tax=Favolaschia claudopus TaxID=2862362 RepID=A0AAV9ZUM5_9AGAR